MQVDDTLALIPDNHIIQFIRNKKNQKNGIMVAFPDEGSDNHYVNIGFSLCSKNDVFNYYRGLGIATGRAFKYSDYSIFDMDDMIPESIRKDVVKFCARCKRYFSDKELVPWAYNLLIEEDFMDSNGNLLVNGKGEFIGG